MELDQQIHGISLKSSRLGDAIFLDVAFHYSFVPPMLVKSMERGLLPAQFQLLDFVLTYRVAQPSVPDQEQLRLGILEPLIADCISVLESTHIQWKDPHDLLGCLTPDLLAEDERQRLDRNLDENEKPFDKAVKHRWDSPRLDHILFFLAATAIHVKEYKLAQEYVKLAESDPFPSALPFGSLKNRIATG
jgi:hypothetical protein